MQRTQLLSGLVELDRRIIEVTEEASAACSEASFELLLNEIHALRDQRAAIQGKLGALPPLI